MIELGLLRRQAHCDVAQRFAPRELRERHDAKHVGTPQCADACIAVVPGDDPPKRLPRLKLHHLREQGLADVHPILRVKSPRIIAARSAQIQIVDTLKSSELQFTIDVTSSYAVFNRTLLFVYIVL